MGQQRREPFLSPCKEKGKETTDQKLMVAVCAKLGIWTGAQWGCVNSASSRASHVSQQAGSDQDPVGHGRAGLRAWASREHQDLASQRWRAAPASLVCKWPLWTEIVETETHKQEQDRPDGENTDALICREGKRKNTETCCTAANSSATALQRVITATSEWEVVLCSMEVIAALCLYNSLWPQILPDWEPSVYVLCPISSVTAQGQNFPAIPTELVMGWSLISGGDHSSVHFYSEIKHTFS